MSDGIITKIQRFSVHDGPGIRTSVFLKGCPLFCWWCHNPETQEFAPERLHDRHRCIRCEACVRACTPGATRIVEGKPAREAALCTECRACAEACPVHALELAGDRVTVAQVMATVLRDRLFYDETGGGVTLTGGEPTSQPDFLRDLLAACTEEGIHTATDTCGYAPWSVFEAILPITSLFLYDLKIADDNKHKEFTGVSNRGIVDNLSRLIAVGAAVEVRMPLIAGVNDSDDDVRAALGVLSTAGVRRLRVLPYHHTGSHKYEKLGQEYRLTPAAAPSDERVGEIKRMMEAGGLTVLWNSV